MKNGKPYTTNMKTTKKILSALAMTALVLSCTREAKVSDDISFGEEITITASIENISRTTLQDGGAQVYWELADEIKVFFKNASGRFISQNDGLAEVADFSGTLNALVGANEGASSSSKLWGLYPYRSDAVLEATAVTTVLPDNQTARAGGFAKNTHITLACSSGLDLAFYNVCGGLRFSLTQEGIKKVTFEGNNEEAIAGTIKMAFVDGLPAIQEVTNPHTKLTLNAPANGTFQTGVYYYIEAVPSSLSRGYTMTFYKEDESAQLTSNSAISFKRGVFGSLNNVDEGLIFKPTGGGGDAPDPEDVISFADPIAKYACIDKFDTNGDGEVSYAEAAAATTLSGLFTDWNTVTSFEEIRFFTGASSTMNVFDGLAQLDSITIPVNISQLGTFRNCKALKKVILPDTLYSLPANCFSGCSTLQKVMLPNGLRTLPRECFNGCGVLTQVELPAGLAYIEDECFKDCKALSSLVIPATVTSIGEFAFQNCKSLIKMTLPTNMKTLPSGLFEGCTALTTITWPSNLQSIGNYAFSDCYFENNEYTLELPASVISIGTGAFVGLRHILIPSTSSVSISSKAFGDPSIYCTYLYVPASKIEMYKFRTNWSDYANRIHQMEDYPVESHEDWDKGTVGEPVDLGLSVQWASWNVGASAPEEYGAFFAWGETAPKVSWVIDYYWSTYKWCKGTDSSMTKYCTNSSYGFNGFTDNKNKLMLEDDAAAANWGDNWRMPTYSEMNELRTQCTWTMTTLNGVSGRKVTSNKEGYTEKWIFLPAAGWIGTSMSWDRGSSGYFWTSSLNVTRPRDAMFVYFDFFSASWNYMNRCAGLSVRPVCDK